MIKKALFLIFTLIVWNGYGQEFSNKVSIVEKKITYKELSSSKYGKKIFQLLAIDNNIDARKLYLMLKSRLSIRVERNENNKLIAGISLTLISIDGSINIKDFAVDSLLWPSSFTTNLLIKNNRHIRDEITVVCTTDGIVNIIDLSDYNTNIGDFSIVSEGVNFDYSKSNYLDLEKIAKSISYYYSYGLLLDKLIGEYKTNAVVANPESGNIFIQKIEVDRIMSYLAKHDMFNNVNVSNRDPIGINKKIRKFERFAKRAETLFADQINHNSDEITEPLDFCSSYYNLSDKYLSISALKQPSEASAFKEVAGISTDNSELSILESVNNYYTNRGNTNTLYVPECIFDGFVLMSEKLISDINYTDALLLLNNSRIISDRFNTELDSKYNKAVTESISGIASSYLKVGYMALKSCNMEFASNYISEANSILESNYPILESIVFIDTSTNELIDLQKNISIQYADYKNYEKALKSLDIAKKICGKQVNNLECLKVDTTIVYIKNRFVRNEIFIFEDLISRFQYPDAYGKYNDIIDYLKINKSIDNLLIQQFNDNSYSLFLVFLQQGEILIDAKQSEAALENLLKAQVIQSNMDVEIVDIDNLILQCAEPVIMKVIEEASYRAWANKLDEAKLLYSEAKIMNDRYFKSNNSNVNIALEKLVNQIDTRRCLDRINDYSDAIKTAKIMVRNHNYDGLPKMMQKAQKTISNYPECNIDSTEFVKFKSDNHEVLGYLRRYSNIRNLLFSKDYDAVIQKYYSLENYYNSNKSVLHTIDFHSLNDFIEVQHIPVLTIEAVSYFSSIGLYELSLDYLILYKNQGGSSKEIKSLTADIAKNLAHIDNEIGVSVTDAIAGYTKGNEKLNYFKLIYIKNRVVKNSE